jgi:hypothetical protein
MAEVRSGHCVLACGCQTFWKSDKPSSNDCEGCEHHLCFHSCGKDECKWVEVKVDNDGEPIIEPQTGLPQIKKRCKCSCLFETSGSNKCEGCGHHRCYHKPVQDSSTIVTPPPRVESSAPASAARVLPTASVSPAEAASLSKVKGTSTKSSGKAHSAPGASASVVDEGELILQKLNPQWVSNFQGKILHTILPLFRQADATCAPAAFSLKK